MIVRLSDPMTGARAEIDVPSCTAPIDLMTIVIESEHMCSCGMHGVRSYWGWTGDYGTDLVPVMIEVPPP